MAIHGCIYNFEDLTHIVLPDHMTSLRKSMQVPIPMKEFNVPGDGAATLAKRHGFDADIIGCYVLIDGLRPIYVGISRHVFRRLREHVRPGDHMTATLAYRLAREHHPFEGTAKEAMKDTAFHTQFDCERKYLLGLKSAVVRIDNPLELYVFEAFCAMELGTGVDDGGWNTFETH